MIHEVKRYDGEGKLIGVISEKECRRDFWRQLDIDADSGDRNGEMKLLKKFGADDARGPLVLGPYRANQKKIPGVCIQCGKDFMGKYAQKFCSDISGSEARDNCRNIHYKMVKAKTHRATLPPKPCGEALGKVLVRGSGEGPGGGPFRVNNEKEESDLN